MEKPIFCAACQVESTHAVQVLRNRDGHVELLATCKCGRTVKFPDGADIARAIAKHKAANVGQVPGKDTKIPADHPLLQQLAKL